MQIGQRNPYNVIILEEDSDTNMYHYRNPSLNPVPNTDMYIDYMLFV